MKIKIFSEKKYIHDSIIEELDHKNKSGQSIDEYSYIMQYSIDELLKMNMREIAQSEDYIVDENRMMDESLVLTEQELSNELKRKNMDFDVERYTKDARKTYAPLAKEMFTLQTRLLDSRKEERIGEKTDLSIEDRFPFEVVEIGLKGLIEGLVLVPLVNEFEIDLEAINHFLKSQADTFPIEIELHDFLYVVDDDGTIFTSTENFPERFVREAKLTLIELGRQIYSASD